MDLNLDWWRVAEVWKSNLEGPQLHIRKLFLVRSSPNLFVCPQQFRSAD
jgi:hypothetical protein